MDEQRDPPDPELDEADWFAAGTLVAPADAVALAVEPDATGVPDADDERPRRGPSWAQVVVLALALAFLGGAVGYVVGKGRPPADDSVDVGFLQDMIDHHEQAIVMSRSVLRKDDVTPVVRTLAEEVLLIQQREIGLMDGQLWTWGKVRGDLERSAMGWMGMRSTVAAMPGMQSDEALAALDAATGSEADRLFLTMMRAHHEGGVHMAADAAERANSERVRDLAGRMERSQRSEIQEYTGVLRQLGLE